MDDAVTPVMCRVKHAPEDGTYGDCVRACIASILDLDGDAVPHFFHDNCDGQTANDRITRWLGPLGFAPFFIHYDGALTRDDLFDMMTVVNRDTYYILYGKVEGGGDHVVVCRGGTVAHNPAWFPTRMIGPGSHGMWTILVIARS